uniref:Chromosome 1 open reading frame 158 n=1 Tax=Suricata suricatta TaxID=37032 RepID=A0A673UN21_SURSU
PSFYCVPTARSRDELTWHGLGDLTRRAIISGVSDKTCGLTQQPRWSVCVKGLPYTHLITHHQEPSHRHLISTYDDHYSRHSYNPGLPPLRTWSGHKLLWLAEKADFPLLAPPTNYGLYEQLKRRWLTPKAGSWESIYTESYPRPPLCALSRRQHAIPVPPPRLHPVPHF